MEMFLEVPATAVTEQDVAEIAAAECRIAKQSVRQRVKAIAAAFGRSESTVRGWVSIESLNPHDMIEVCQWVEWKDRRARNRRHLDGRPRRIRSPFD